MVLLLSRWLLRCVVEWKEVSSRPGLSAERESWVFVSEYGPSSERSEDELDEIWRELSKRVGSFGRNESVVVLGDFNA